jgi:hypothetical protein
MAPPSIPGPAPAEAPPTQAAGPGRYSLGGGEARRVLVQQPWRVKDLVLPPGPAGAPSLTPTASSAMPPPAAPTPAAAAATPRATPAVTAEERRAIQERRRSAVREFKDDAFWRDGVPGMSPTKNAARMSVGDAGVSSTSQGIRGTQLGAGNADVTNGAMATPKRLVFGSPTKGRALGYAIAEEGTTAEDSKLGDADAEDEELDTRSLLDRMRETVDDMKRRRSVIASTPRVESTASAPTATVERSVLLRAAPIPAGTPTSVALASPERERPALSMGMGSVKKLDFTRITTPARRAGSAKPASSSSSGLGMSEPEMTAEPEAATEAAEVDEEPFSLLRPVTREVSPSRNSHSRSTRGTRRAAQEAEEQGEAAEDVRAVPLPAVVVEALEEDATEEAVYEEEQEKPKDTRGKAKGRSRLLRAPKPVVVEEVEDVESLEDVHEVCSHGLLFSNPSYLALVIAGKETGCMRLSHLSTPHLSCFILFYFITHQH